MSDSIAFEGWAVIELMGHRQRAGYVKDVEMFGGKLLRIDIPVEPEVNVTEFYGCSALYALRPCTEAIARKHCTDYSDPRPVAPVDYKPADSSHLNLSLQRRVPRYPADEAEREDEI